MRFPGVDTGRLPQFDDEAFALHLLETEDVLIVPGSSFNVGYRNHFRITLLPEADVIADVFARIERALARTAEGLAALRVRSPEAHTEPCRSESRRRRRAFSPSAIPTRSARASQRVAALARSAGGTSARERRQARRRRDHRNHRLDHR